MRTTAGPTLSIPCNDAVGDGPGRLESVPTPDRPMAASPGRTEARAARGPPGDPGGGAPRIPRLLGDSCSEDSGTDADGRVATTAPCAGGVRRGAADPGSSLGVPSVLDGAEGAGAAGPCLSLGVPDAPDMGGAAGPALALNVPDGAADGGATAGPSLDEGMLNGPRATMGGDAATAALSFGAAGAGSAAEPSGTRGFGGGTGGGGSATITDPGAGHGLEGRGGGGSPGLGMGRATGAAPGEGVDSAVFSPGATGGLSLGRVTPLDAPDNPEAANGAAPPVPPAGASRNGIGADGCVSGLRGVAVLSRLAAAGGGTVPLAGPDGRDGGGGTGSSRAIWDSAVRGAGAIRGASRSGPRLGDAGAVSRWPRGAGETRSAPCDGLTGPAGGTDSGEAAWGSFPEGTSLTADAVSVAGERSSAPVPGGSSAKSAAGPRSVDGVARVGSPARLSVDGRGLTDDQSRGAPGSAPGARCAKRSRDPVDWRSDHAIGSRTMPATAAASAERASCVRPRRPSHTGHRMNSETVGATHGLS